MNDAVNDADIFDYLKVNPDLLDKPPAMVAEVLIKERIIIESINNLDMWKRIERLQKKVRKFLDYE